jgi:hypothetical protein
MILKVVSHVLFGFWDYLFPLNKLFYLFFLKLLFHAIGFSQMTADIWMIFVFKNKSLG